MEEDRSTFFRLHLFFCILDPVLNIFPVKVCNQAVCQLIRGGSQCFTGKNGISWPRHALQDIADQFIVCEMNI